MKGQQSLFPGEKLRDEDIKQASNNADKKYDNWTSVAFGFLIGYIRELSYDETFMAEDIRYAAAKIVPLSPSNRAWGAVILRAAKEKFIVKVGYDKVKNHKAHCTPAAVWKRM